MMKAQGADARELRERLLENHCGMLARCPDPLCAAIEDACAALERVEALEKLVREMRDHLDVAIQFDHDDHGGCYPSTHWDFTAQELCVMADRLFVAAPGGSHGAGGNTEAAVQDSRPPAGRAETHPLGQHPFPAPGVATPAPQTPSEDDCCLWPGTNRCCREQTPSEGGTDGE